MAIQPVHQPIYRGNFYGLKTPTWGGIEKPSFAKETASQTYRAGDLLYVDSNGTVALCTTSSDVLNVTLLGQATKKATGTTGQIIHFRPIIPNDLYLMNVFHLTAASAVITQATFADRTCRRGIYMKTGAVSTTAAPLTTNLGSNLNWVVDMNTAGEDATHAQAYGQIIDCPQRLTDGTLNAFTDIFTNVMFRFMNYSHETGTGADPAALRCLYFGG